MMRKLAVLMALASTALASPALARDNAWYVGVEGGAMIVEDLEFDVTNAAGVTTGSGLIVDHEYGYDVDAVMAMTSARSASKRRLVTAARWSIRSMQPFRSRPTPPTAHC